MHIDVLLQPTSPRLQWAANSPNHYATRQNNVVTGAELMPRLGVEWDIAALVPVARHVPARPCRLAQIPRLDTVSRLSLAAGWGCWDAEARVRVR